MKTELFIDGDLITFIIAAAAEKREVEVKHVPSGKTKLFKTRTEFKKHMQASEKEITEDYVFRDIQKPDKLENVFNAIKYKITNIVDFVEADTYEVFTGGKDNFRDELPLPSKYKGQRENTLRPVHLKAALGYVADIYNSKPIKGHETDDELNICAYAALARGNKAVIATIDKDAYQAEGVHIFNFDKDPLTVELITSLGELRLQGTNKTVKGQGLKFFCYQLLYGDDSDNYSPYELKKNEGKFGSMSAYKLLVDLETEVDCLKKVIETYKKWYPEEFEYRCWQGKLHKADWKSMLSLYFKCAYMKRTKDDPSDVVEFFKQRGVDINEA
jgi:hypothetical protein